MELWLDTIDFSTIEEINKMLHIAGITTNPSILAKSKSPFQDTINKLLDIQGGLIAIQVVANNHTEMIKQAEKIYSISNRIIIKIPTTTDGLQAIKYLSKNNIPTLATAVFELKQIILSNLAGAKYVAPYVSKIENGFIALNAMMDIIKINNYPIKVMAASIKHVNDIINSAKLGTHAITIPAEILHNFVNDISPTIKCLNKFEDDWQSNSNMNFENI